MASLTRREIFSLAAVAAAGATASVVLRRTAPLGRDVSEELAARGILEDTDWPSFGPSEANLTIVTFTDYRCPACLYAAPKLDEAVAKDGKVRLVYRDWPIFGAQSEAAARATIAAHFQGRYVAMHKALMASRVPLDAVSIMRIADQAGVDTQRLGADLKSRSVAIDERLARNRLDAARLRIPGTPGYLIGPLLVVGALQVDEFTAAFTSARQA
jgi:protein-disulfide isomerase